MDIFNRRKIRELEEQIVQLKELFYVHIPRVSKNDSHFYLYIDPYSHIGIDTVLCMIIDHFDFYIKNIPSKMSLISGKEELELIKNKTSIKEIKKDE